MKCTFEYPGEPSSVTITFDRVEARLLKNLAGSVSGEASHPMRNNLTGPLYRLLAEAGFESMERQFETSSIRVKE